MWAASYNTFVGVDSGLLAKERNATSKGLRQHLPGRPKKTLILRVLRLGLQFQQSNLTQKKAKREERSAESPENLRRDLSIFPDYTFSFNALEDIGITESFEGKGKGAQRIWTEERKKRIGEEENSSSLRAAWLGVSIAFAYLSPSAHGIRSQIES